MISGMPMCRAAVTKCLCKWSYEQHEVLNMCPTPKLWVEFGSAAGEIQRVHRVECPLQQLQASIRSRAIHALLDAQGGALDVAVAASLVAVEADVELQGGWGGAGE